MSGFDRKSKGGSGPGRSAGIAARSPGKRSLTDGMARARAPEAAPDVDDRPVTAGEMAQATVDTRDSGEAPDPTIRAGVEAQLGVSLPDVRVHRDEAAQAGTEAIGARAFAYGSDVFLGPGESPGDTELVAHELTHVAQQVDTEDGPQRQIAIGAADSPAEHHADAVAAAVAGGAPPAALLVEDGAELAPGQMHKTAFLDQLEASVRGAASDVLGPVWSVAGCPYVLRAFAQYRGRPAADCERVLRRYSGSRATTADQLIPAAVQRVHTGLAQWRETGAMPADIPDIGPEGTSAAAPADGGPAEPGSAAQLKARLGEGESLGGGVASAAADAYGADLGSVRIHTGAEAARLASEHGATALTVGSDIAFASGAYRPGTLSGDALLAHELAHVAQQQGADDAQRRRKLGEEDEAAEDDADVAAGGLIARLKGGARRLADRLTTARPKMRTDLNLQRCGRDWVHDPGLAQRLGLQIQIAPEPSADRPALVGSNVRLSLHQGDSSSDESAGAVHWEATDPRGNLVQDRSGPEQSILVGWPGTWHVRARVEAPGGENIEWAWIERSFEAVRADARSDALLTGMPDAEGYQGFSNQQTLLMALAAPDNSPAADAEAFIASATANPVAVATPPAVMQFGMTRRRPAPPRLTQHWYARPFRWDGMPDQLGGHRKVPTDSGDSYDLGTGANARLPAAHKNTYVIACEQRVDGNRVGELTYLQSVMESAEIEQLDRLREGMAISDRHVGELARGGDGQPQTVPVTAVHVGIDSGSETPLNLYVGRLASDTGRVVLINATPGLDPEHEQLRYEGGSLDEVLTAFEDGNHLPAGSVSLRVPGGIVTGIGPATRTIRTTGESDLANASGLFGAAALVLGIAAIPFTGGGSLVATALVIASAAAGVTAGTLSLLDHLRNEQLSTTDIALDVLMIASSFFNGAAAIRAMRGGPVILTATRGGQFLLWTAFTTDAVAGLLVGVQGVHQIDQILDSNMPADEKQRALVRVVANLIMTGALLALSVRQMGHVNERIGAAFPDLDGPLSVQTRMTLSHFDDATLTALRGATGPELDRLVHALRDDPSALQRLMNRRTQLLPALRGTAGDTIADLERELLRLRMVDLGVPPPQGTRMIDALRDAGLTGAQLHALDDAAIDRIRQADAAFAGNHLDEAIGHIDGMTSVPATMRGEIESALARAHGRPDPAFRRDPNLALRSKFPEIRDDVWTRLFRLDRDALSALHNASRAQLESIAHLVDLDVAVANRLVKLMGADVATHTFEAAAGGQLRINGQLEIHPSRLAEIADADLRTILEATLGNPPDTARLRPFTTSGSYRLRFRYQLVANETWLSDLFARAGLDGRPEAQRLLAGIDDAGRMRLNELTGVSHPAGMKVPLEDRAARYALDQDPPDVREFVNHFEMFTSEYTRRRAALVTRVDARRAELVAAGTDANTAHRQANREIVGLDAAGFAAPFNRAVLDGSPAGPYRGLSDVDVQDRASALETELAGRFGARSAGAGIDESNVATRVQSMPDLQFSSVSSATYHANKHWRELPSAHRRASYASGDLNQYMRSARDTIAGGTATVERAQDGALSLRFERTFDGKTMLARVRVDVEGNAVITTYAGKAQ